MISLVSPIAKRPKILTPLRYRPYQIIKLKRVESLYFSYSHCRFHVFRQGSPDHVNLAGDVPYKNMNRLDASVLGSGHGFVLTAKKVRKQKHRKMSKNSSFENQIILREEETEITDIEETSITELRSDLSQGSSNHFF